MGSTIVGACNPGAADSLRIGSAWAWLGSSLACQASQKPGQDFVQVEGSWGSLALLEAGLGRAEPWHYCDSVPGVGMVGLLEGIRPSAVVGSLGCSWGHHVLVQLVVGIHHVLAKD